MAPRCNLPLLAAIVLFLNGTVDPMHAQRPLRILVLSVDRPPRTITASTAPDAAPSTKLHNLSDSDSVYIGSPPMAASLDKTPKSSAAGTGDVDQHELITTLPQVNRHLLEMLSHLAADLTASFAF